MNAKEMQKIMNDYRILCNDVDKMKKVYTHTKTFKHSLVGEIIAIAVLPLYYSIYDNGAFTTKAVIPTCIASSDVEVIKKDWLKIADQSSRCYKSVSLEEFLALPDWTDGHELLLTATN